MRFFASLVLSFQFMMTPVIAGTGQQPEYSNSQNLIQLSAEAQSEAYYEQLQAGIKAWSEGELEKFITASGYQVGENVRSAIRSLVSQGTKIKFEEKVPGFWAARIQSFDISFSVDELYFGKIRVNGKLIETKEVPFPELEKALESLTPKTSFLQQVFQNTIGIPESHAIAPVILVGIVAGIIALGGIATLKLWPSKAVNLVNGWKNKMDAEASSCEAAKHDQAAYNQTHRLAEAIGDKRRYNSYSPVELLRLALKEQLENGWNNRECSALLNQTGVNQIHDDIKSAIRNMCASYNQLGACMANYVHIHINGTSGIGNFRGKAPHDFNQYREINRRSKGQ